MADWKKLLIGASALGTLLGGRYLLRLLKLKDKLLIEKKGMIYQFNLEGVILRVYVTFSNSTGIGARIDNPNVTILYKGKTVANSILVDADSKSKKGFDIPKNGKKTMQPIDIKASYLNLAVTVPGMIQEYTSKGKIALTIQVETKIDGWYQYKDSEEVVLGGKKKDEGVNGMMLWGWW